MRTFTLMHGALDDRLVMHWLQCRYCGLVEGEVTPLFGLLSAQFSRFRSDGEGGHCNVRAEASFITDTDTGTMVTAPARNYLPSSPHIRVELQRRGAKRVPCDISITNTVNWRSWMNMGDQPGICSSPVLRGSLTCFR